MYSSSGFGTVEQMREPLDASDIISLEEGKKEIQKLRKILADLRNEECKSEEDEEILVQIQSRNMSCRDFQRNNSHSWVRRFHRSRRRLVPVDSEGDVIHATQVPSPPQSLQPEPLFNLSGPAVVAEPCHHDLRLEVEDLGENAFDDQEQIIYCFTLDQAEEEGGEGLPQTARSRATPNSARRRDSLSSPWSPLTSPLKKLVTGAKRLLKNTSPEESPNPATSPRDQIDRQEAERIISLLQADKERLEREKASLEAEVAALRPPHPPFWCSTSGLVEMDLVTSLTFPVSLRVSGEEMLLQYLLDRFESLPSFPRERVLKIYRNQNEYLWQQYWKKRCEIEAQNSSSLNEKLLFYGSSPEDIDKILQNGFTPEHLDPDGPLGCAIHFSSSSVLAHPNSYFGGCLGYNERENLRGTETWPKMTQVYKMLFCRIAAGKRGPGSRGLQSSPLALSGGVYTSVTNVQPLNSIPARGLTAVFDSHQIFPEFVLVYKFG